MSLLEIRNLQVKYGAITALKGVSISVEPGQIVTMIGANGAGKSTLLRAVSGLIKACAGNVVFEGVDITNLPAHRVVALGISHAPEGRMIFANLSVRENLEMGAYPRANKGEIGHDLERVFSLFPRLKERFKQSGGTLSGGEQQMLAIGRAMMARPRMLLLDEPSLGIGPILVKAIFETIVEINRELGMTILLVEQNAHQALKIAQYGYVLETGHIALEGSAGDIARNEQIRKAYLGEA
ncbi:MAG: ABC transporter ATP-binding protein [candidate division Zixibacteria bacterium RBG_16_53_22]|nr:MAG: ABC transporter ATP-binding protein [candidate division Zixibacteria bacterium RBG_16_53_22]